MSLLDRHLALVQALRDAGLPVALSEGLDAVRAIEVLGLHERETLRAAYAATLLTRQSHRPSFDQVFDLYFPALVGDGFVPGMGIVQNDRPLEKVEEAAERSGLSGSDDDLVGRDSPQALADFREALTTADET